MKYNSGISGEHKVSPEDGGLTPYFDSLSPVSNELSPAFKEESNLKSNNSGDTGYTGDKFYISISPYNEKCSL